MFDRDSWQQTLPRFGYVLPAIAFFAAFAARYHFLTTYRYPMMIHEQDAVGYMEVAKSFMQLRLPPVVGRPPGYPLVIALFSVLPFGLEFAARLASIFMDALTVFPLFALARIFLPRLESFLACILWAFFPFSLCFSPSPLSQSSYLCYLLAGIALLHRGFEKEGPGWFWGSGVFFALSYLARPEGIVGFACGFIICLTVCFEQHVSKTRKFVLIGCFLLGFLLLALPFLVNLRIACGNWCLSPLTEAHVKTADTISTLNSKGELLRTGSSGISAWKEKYKTFPMFAADVKANISAFANVYVSTLPLWLRLFSGLGLLAITARRRWRNVALLLILVAVTAPNYIVTISKTPSYLYPVYALTLIFLVAGFNAVSTLAVQAAKKFLPALHLTIIAAVCAGVMVLAVSSVVPGFYTVADENYQAPGLVHEVMVTEKIFKGAGEIIKYNSQANDIIMTRWGLVGYFAGRPVLTLPKGGVQEVIAYGRKNGARFMLIDTDSVFSRRQELRELLGPLEGKMINPSYGIDVLSRNYFEDLGGYVVYRFR